MFSYYELGFRSFELNLFSQCFDSVRFEKFKPEQALRTLDWKDSLFTRNSTGARYTKSIGSLELRHNEVNNDPYSLHNNTIAFTQ